MKRNTPAVGKKENALRQLKSARNNLLLMIILTAANILLFALGRDTMLLFSATVPYYTAVFGLWIEGLYAVIGIGISAVILIVYLLCWIFSKKHYGWMIAALALFVADSIAMVALYIWAKDSSGILDILIHAWVLYYLVISVKYGIQLKHISPEEELEYQRMQSMEEASGTATVD